MSVLDIFSGNAFNVTSLTDAINLIPHKPGRLGELAVFSNKGVTSRSVIIEERDGVLQLLVSKPYGLQRKFRRNVTEELVAFWFLTFRWTILFLLVKFKVLELLVARRK